MRTEHPSHILQYVKHKCIISEIQAQCNEMHIDFFRLLFGLSSTHITKNKTFFLIYDSAVCGEINEKKIEKFNLRTLKMQKISIEGGKVK